MGMFTLCYCILGLYNLFLDFPKASQFEASREAKPMTPARIKKVQESQLKLTLPLVTLITLIYTKVIPRISLGYMRPSQEGRGRKHILRLRRDTRLSCEHS